MSTPAFEWARVTIPEHSFQRIWTWPITSILSPSVELRSSGDDLVRCPHTKDSVWPVIDTGAGAWGAINASLWAALPMPDGSWRVGTFDQLRAGQTTKDMERHYGKSYALAFDDAYAIQPGDVIGYMVSTPARNGTGSGVQERSNLVLIRYGTSDWLWDELNTDDLPTPTPTPPTYPPAPNPGPSLEARVAALEQWARSFR